MSVSKSIAALSLGMLLPAGAALAQAQPGAAPQTVTVSGKRAAKADPTQVTAATSAILSRHLASGCNYMSAYSAAGDDVTRAYMRNMAPHDTLSDEVERFDERSPDGDASTSTAGSSIPKEKDEHLEAARGGCGPGDRRFAAGRNRILRKDKSLANALQAFAVQDYAAAREQAHLAWTRIGYDEAALMLARLYLSGLGVPQNTVQAVAWLDKVAMARFDPIRDRVQFDPKDPEAMTARVEATLLLAKVYLRGIGTAKDPAQATRWYAKAAEIGFVPATNTLGMAAMDGYGMPKSARKAAALFTEAAQAGYAPAQYNLARLHYLGEEGIPQDLKLAGAWFAQAARSGHAGALFAAGRMYDLGEGVPADQQKAIVYYKDAALKANADAQSALATYFYTGEVVQKDLATARKLFAAAARQGHPDALFNMGVMTANAQAGVKDMAGAYAWFALARDAGHPDAPKALAQIGPQLTAAERGRVDAALKPQQPERRQASPGAASTMPTAQ